ncbi:MAG: sensor histidine kinase [Gemmatimonadota bacterium]
MEPAAPQLPGTPPGQAAGDGQAARDGKAARGWRSARRWLTETVAAGVTDPPAPRPARLRRGRVDLVFAADVVLAAILFGATNGALGAQNTQHHLPHSSNMIILVSFVLCAPLVLRTRLPLTAFSASVAAMLWASLVIPPRSLSGAIYPVGGVIVYLLCLYAVAVRCKPWVVAGTAAVTMLGAAVIDLRSSAGALLAAIPLLIGIIVRVRRSGDAELAAQEQRHVGERALLEERQRIARELHDIVAHHMSVIAIQAEAAPYKTPDPPPALVESFGEIRASALSGLGELRRLLGVLRSEEPGTAPQPGLDDLDGLVESARSGGVTVTAVTSGTPRPLPEGVDLSAYRIVQEALSNAMRHSPGAAVQIQLGYQDGYLLIEVRNDSCPPDAGPQPGPAGAAPGGHGIIGMRERAAMLGGHLAARPTANGEFLVTAYLPVGNGQAEAAS